jgi:hypothetical protein
VGKGEGIVSELVNKYGFGIAKICELRGEEPKRIGSSRSGENALILYRFSDGAEVIQTNGDPVWEGDHAFQKLRETSLWIDEE